MRGVHPLLFVLFQRIADLCLGTAQTLLGSTQLCTQLCNDLRLRLQFSAQCVNSGLLCSTSLLTLLQLALQRLLHALRFGGDRHHFLLVLALERLQALLCAAVQRIQRLLVGGGQRLRVSERVREFGAGLSVRLVQSCQLCLRLRLSTQIKVQVRIGSET